MKNIRYHAEAGLPKHPSLDEKLRWHIMHHSACNCRPVPLFIKKELKKRKLPC